MATGTISAQRATTRTTLVPRRRERTASGRRGRRCRREERGMRQAAVVGVAAGGASVDGTGVEVGGGWPGWGTWPGCAVWPGSVVVVGGAVVVVVGGGLHAGRSR